MGTKIGVILLSCFLSFFAFAHGAEHSPSTNNYETNNSTQTDNRFAPGTNNNEPNNRNPAGNRFAPGTNNNEANNRTPANNRFAPGTNNNEPINRTPTGNRIAPKSVYNPKFKTHGTTRSPRDKTFHRPRIAGAPMNWCLGLNIGCGQETADAYCRQQGFQHAHSFRVDPNVNYTKILGSRQLCTHPKCATFKRIRCVANPSVAYNTSPAPVHPNSRFSYQDPSRFREPHFSPSHINRNFRLPTLGGVALNFCLGHSKSCGQPVADRYCRRKGFRRSLHYSRLASVGKTKYIQTGKNCYGNSCNSFSFIKCSN